MGDFRGRERDRKHPLWTLLSDDSGPFPAPSDFVHAAARPAFCQLIIHLKGAEAKAQNKNKPLLVSCSEGKYGLSLSISLPLSTSSPPPSQAILEQGNSPALFDTC